MKNLFINFINFYKIYINPYLLHKCRFYPSCSSYILLSIKKLPIIKGLYFSVKRIILCNCFSSGGYDPIP
ncbi:MAG: membrane protein insertion efficiency factor YidD [Candidatus Azosocius agrarius]|nr:MAG: membrane protein insertion efficiency factor YidD [Gammaproteobacteria bacterium]